MFRMRPEISLGYKNKLEYSLCCLVALATGALSCSKSGLEIFFLFPYRLHYPFDVENLNTDALQSVIS